MGIYVYTLRAESKKIILGHTKVKAHLLKFAFKEYYGINGIPARHKAIITRTENYWEDKEFPKHVVIGDKFEEGAPVYSEYPNCAWCYDTPNFPGKFVGYLKRKENQWVIVEKYPVKNT